MNPQPASGQSHYPRYSRKLGHVISLRTDQVRANGVGLDQVILNRILPKVDLIYFTLFLSPKSRIYIFFYPPRDAFGWKCIWDYATRACILIGQSHLCVM